MNDTVTAIDQGLADANPQQAAECAEVKRLTERVEKTRQFDEEALKQYARDRRYARGDSGFSVDANILGTFIDILVAFLYAKDPDIDVLPAKATEPPSLEALRDAAAVDVDQDPRVVQAGQQAASVASWGALAMGQNPGEVGQQAGQMAAEMMREQVITERFEELQAAYRKRQRDNKAFSETLELVISRLWAQAKLKARAKPMVRSALSIGVGWLKASWQARTGHDPITRQKIADLRDNIAKAAKLRQDMDEQSGTELDVTMRDYQAQLTALQGEAERVIARGMAIDFVNAEDITVAPGVELNRYLDAPWIDHRIPMLVEDAMAEFKLTKEQGASLTRYKQRKPVMTANESPLATDNIAANDADQFQEGGGEVGDWCMVHETWDRDANTIRTWIEGLKVWARPPAAPVATTRFYGFFMLPLGEIDGQRHPQSLVARSAKLVDEYNRIGSAEREHRARIKPKTLFRKGQIGGEQASVIIGAETGEFVPVEMTNPNGPLADLFYPLPYPELDPALYDRSRIRNELETIWGIQEALSGGIDVAKTATEAQIQQSGMQARTGAQRDALEDVLAELALYTAEVALASLDEEDVRAMIGPDAMWPQFESPDDLARLVNVDIRAGSSGKPNTTADREAMAALLPLLQSGVQRIGMLRNSTPADMADAEEALLRLVIERSGDRIDLESLLPTAGPAMPMPMPGAAPTNPAVADPAAPAVSA